MKDFLSWLTEHSDPLLNEYGFLGTTQKVGELVFFGIHLLNRQYSELNQFPFLSLSNNPDRINISNYVTEIIDTDPVRRTIIVMPEWSPYTMGYRSGNINKKDSKGQIYIPSKQLEDVTFLLPQESQSKRLWVVITNDYQRKLAANLRRREAAAQNAKLQAMQTQTW